jgi:hypothetical protein
VTASTSQERFGNYATKKHASQHHGLEAAAIPATLKLRRYERFKAVSAAGTRGHRPYLNVFIFILTTTRARQ